MAETKDIARALIRTELPNREIAGILLELADVHHPESMPTPPAAVSVEKLMKRGWSKIATAVVSGAEEYLGPRLVKHSSIQVRRLLADHSSDQPTLQALHLWSVDKDSECFSSTLYKVDPAWLLDLLLADQYQCTRGTLATVANRIVLECPDRFGDVGNLPLPQRNVMLSAVADQIALGRVADWDLVKLFAELTTEATETAAQIVMDTHFDVLPEAVVDAMLTDPKAARVLRDRVFRSAQSFDTAAARKLIKISVPHALRVVSTKWDHALFDDLISLQSHAVVEAILDERETIRRLTKAELSAALMSITDVEMQPDGYRPTSLNRSLLKSIEFDLDEDVLLTYLRLSGPHATWEWLNGATPQQPRPGEAATLIQNSGLAFGYDRLYNNSGPRFQSPSIAEIASNVADQIIALAAMPWCDEVVDACGSECVDALLHRYNADPGAAYLSARIRRELGDAPEVWRDAIAHLSKTRLSVGKTLNAVRKLRSMSTPEQHTPPAPPATPRPSQERYAELEHLQKLQERTYERINALQSDLGL